ncbi:MAG: MFS transporter [Chloroflexi bacterium]|nr:MFS transporter [Chloroflexota bacterium]MCL5074046.1 MFS transporter [Chloroflexota bacterium]
MTTELFSALQHRNFRLYWLGTLASLTGYWIQIVAQGWLVLEMTDSAFLLGLVSFCSSIPLLLFSLFGGALADRMDRRRLLIATQTMSMLLTLLLAVLTYSGAITIWQILLISTLLGTVAAFHIPTRQALVPNLVDSADLLNAIALTSVAFNATRIVGPAMAGVLVGLIGIGGCFYITAASFLPVIVALFAMEMSPSSPNLRGSPMWANIVEGLTYVRDNSIVLMLIALATVPSIFAMPYSILMPIFARDILGVGASGLGLLMAGNGVGALVGSLVVAGLGNYQGRGRLLLVTTFLFSLLLMFFATASWFWHALILLVGVGLSGAVYLSLTNVLLQSCTPDGLRGRVMSVYTLSWGLGPLGYIEAGAVANTFGAPFAVFLGGTICAITAVTAALRSSSLRLLR